MDNVSLGGRVAPAIAGDAAGRTVRCPSCDHANPALANFCNLCGMPVHFEACGRCEAINRRGAPFCHKCGCVLPWSAKPEPAAAAPAIVETLPSQAAERLDSNNDLPPDVAEPAPRGRHTGIRVALFALGVALVAVPTYMATDPAPPVEQTSEPVNAPPVAPAATHEAAPVVTEVASAPPSEIARDFRDSNAAASTAVAPPVAKSARSSATKSQASRSKSTTSSRKPPARKPATRAS